MKEIINLKTTDIKTLKEKWYLEQEQICPILKKGFNLEKMVLDHYHATNSDTIGENGKGCCRGVIEFRANSLEGKITNNFKRLGLDKDIDLPTFLRNLADYLENNHLNDDILYVHPTEVRKEPKLSKRQYNKLQKLYLKSGKKKKFPEFPKSGKLTKDLEKLFIEFNLSPWN